jgi:2-oxoacid:acceptor oxidoreductase delta subunit (pyruvate/2-ketoisovalerate family)
VTERPFAITLDVGSSHANHTGSWRTERPVYVGRQPPCNDGCPTGEDIQRWLYLAESGDYGAAWRVLVEDNPLPAVSGRICYHPCESACNRAQLDEAVGINSVERFLGDWALEQGLELPAAGAPSGRRVLVVGSGPSGLGATYHLRRLGHEVVLVEQAEQLGGMMRYAIPAYRLPRQVLDAEIERILRLGVEVRTSTRVEDLAALLDAEDFDATFLAVGAQLAHRVEIPAGDSARVLDALGLFRSIEEHDPPLLGRRVAIYGGDSAIDVARSARRLGATEAVIVYRRTRERMPGHEEELLQALGEGVTVRWLSTITRVDEGQIVIEKMALDESGTPRPTGEFETLGADSLVLALGQDSDLSLVGNEPGIEVREGALQVTPTMMTGMPGVFAGGDAVPSERTATVALGHARRAAGAIDRYLGGAASDTGREARAPPTFERLNPWYYADAERTVRGELEQIRRQSSFEEVVLGLNEDNALFEARRCLSCGNCFGCDNCYGVCPDNAVIKLEVGRYEFDYDFCKGCGICATECPCGAIEMVPEEI